MNSPEGCRIGLLGATGRMGRCVASLIEDGADVRGRTFELVDAVAADQPPVEVAGVLTRQIFEAPRDHADVWIDFSAPPATLALLETITAPILIATTGFGDTQLADIRKYATTHAVLLASNTSVGMNVMMDLLRRLPEGLPFDVNLSEQHHRHKRDAPSGTAKSLLEILAGRGYDEVPVQVVRAGGLRGVHTVQLVAEDEILEIRHEAWDRAVFAEGALRAAAFLTTREEPGLYSMQDVIEYRGLD